VESPSILNQKRKILVLIEAHQHTIKDAELALSYENGTQARDVRQAHAL